ncbi:DUF861 domain-containing protein [Duganella sp. FT92W]|uniref:DUF861 domain-containing protein n=1 Tax=Pseudoduganella rivuli TaxID=2666085 RepID=A0A7X2LTD0_9BURK|nr:cupin domain-containing protein [Pseudoduganella rivuli]MRV71729.1 DUF861 domain-containing protein [Pseudoduganella rivuli]
MSNVRVPSFVDLRQFAQDRSQGIPVTAEAGADCFLSSRRVLDWAPGPVTAGVITLDGGSGEVSSLPADEFIIVNEGSVTLSQRGVSLTLEANQSAVIQQGAAFSWSAQGPVCLIFTRYNRSQPGNRAIVPIKANPPLEPTGTPPADLLLTPAPVCRNFTDYRSADGEFVCGTWDSTPYHRRAMFYRHYELMYLLAGSVTFVDEAGRSGTFTKDDIFLVEQTAQCSWESRVDVAKVYVIYRPA